MSSPSFPFPQGTQPQVSRTKPRKYPDGAAPMAVRFGSYGEPYALSPIPTKHLLTDEGSYFYATNPAIDTQVTYGIQATFSDTAGTFAIKNNDQPGGAFKRIYLDFVRIAFTGATPVVPVTAIGAKMVVRVDNINRAPTANNASLTVVNPNMDDMTGTIANVQAFAAGTLTLPAAGPSIRTAARAWMRHCIPVTQDELICMFGGIEAGGGTVGTTAGRVVSAAPAVVIGPQQWALIHIYFPGNATTAGAFEYDLGWWER